MSTNNIIWVNELGATQILFNTFKTDKGSNLELIKLHTTERIDETIFIQNYIEYKVEKTYINKIYHDFVPITMRRLLHTRLLRDFEYEAEIAKVNYYVKTGKIKTGDVNLLIDFSEETHLSLAFASLGCFVKNYDFYNLDFELLYSLNNLYYQ